MKVKILILALISLFLVSCENTPENPFSPEPPAPVKKPAEISIWGRNINYYLDINDPSKAEWKVSGRLTNSGDLPAKNIKVNSKIYDSLYNILWEGSFLFINPNSNTSYLNAGEAHDFIASWEGLDSNIFSEWDYNRTLTHGIEITWEEVTLK